jgi:hypothetical protein
MVRPRMGIGTYGVVDTMEMAGPHPLPIGRWESASD